ncbi:uncharacterized protein METZ01_LOCUS229751 [marine metagenome]|uniref:Uncharacterized protein n=1 Tax=marine metagenome TaxID=408172 RepID=A0A382GQH9_9ZZZZ
MLLISKLKTGSIVKEKHVNTIWKKIYKTLKAYSGNSLAEFATVAALMATLAATAAPKLSKLAETAKSEKSMNEIDKILTQARNFYQATQDEEGRGRFPGQDKFNRPVGNYGTANSSYANQVSAQTTLLNELDNFIRYNSSLGAKWRSVFGISNLTAPAPSGSTVQNDPLESCLNCPASTSGSEEWIELFGGNTLFSTFQDGHFIYAVLPGGGSGTGAFVPILIVADLENPKDFNNILEP